MCADGSYVGRNHHYNCTFFCEDEIKMIEVNSSETFQTTDILTEDMVSDDIIEVGLIVKLTME